MYRIQYSREAAERLRRMPLQVVTRVRERLAAVAAEPSASHPGVAKLQNRPGYRLRVGDWRVIYTLEHDQLVVRVVRIATRGEVYR